MSSGRSPHIRTRRAGRIPTSPQRAPRRRLRLATRNRRPEGTNTPGPAEATACDSDDGQGRRRILPDVRPGAVIGAYRIETSLGTGGMGEVYRARDLALGRDVAIKLLRTGPECHPRRLLEFDREARMLAALTHPHIGGIYGVIDLAVARGLVLELVDGPTLAQRLSLGPLTPEDAISYALQIAAALEAAHDKGIVHRDLKPANLAIAPRGVVKVLDFGIAQLTREAATSTDAPTMSLPTAGTRRVSGTAAYMSPEQARGRQTDTRTDIWAFGCVLYEMLTAQRAFGGATEADMIGALLHREPAFTALPAKTPPSLRRLIGRCLEKDPDRRLRDIADARPDLEEALREIKQRVDEGGFLSALRRRWFGEAPGRRFDE